MPINTDGYIGDLVEGIARDSRKVASGDEDPYFAMDTGLSWFMAVSAFFGKGAAPFIPELQKTLDEMSKMVNEEQFDTLNEKNK